MKKNVVNFRTLFIIASVFAIGILCAKDFLSCKISTIIFSVLLLSVFLIWAIIDKSYKKILIPLISFAVGVGVFFLASFTYLPKSQDNVFVEGRVESIVTSSETYQTFILDDVKIDNKNCNKNIYINYFSHGKNVSIGDNITFTTSLQNPQMLELNEYNTYFYKNNVGYTCKLQSTEIEILNNNIKHLEKFRQSVKNTITKVMNDDNASVAYASLFGDKSEMDIELKNAFSSVGVAHLLAVSGLHIGFLVGVLIWILTKLKLNKKWHVLVVGPLLLAYCFLCGFSTSVVRASIMAICLLLGRSLGEKYDPLTSISVALLIILLVKPLLIFDGGTQLSFLCVFAIITLAPRLTNLFKKIKFGKLSSTLATILSVQIGILPLTIKMFGQISLLTILANFICIPIFEIAYISLMILIWFAIIPGCSKILIISEFFINTICATVLNFSATNMTTLSFAEFGSVFNYCYVIILFVISGFVMLSKKTRSLVICYLVFMMALFVGIDKLQFGLDKYSLACFAETENIYVIKSKHEVYLVNLSKNYNDDLETIKSYLNYLNVYKIDKIFSFYKYDLDTIYQTQNSEVEYMCDYRGDSFSNAVQVDVGQYKVLIIANIRNQNEMNEIEFEFRNNEYDLVINNSSYQTKITSKEIIMLEEEDNASFTIRFDCDKLGEKRSLA